MGVYMGTRLMFRSRTVNTQVDDRTLFKQQAGYAHYMGCRLAPAYTRHMMNGELPSGSKYYADAPYRP